MASVFDLVKLFTTGSLSKDEILNKVSSHTVSSTQPSVTSSRLMVTHRSFQFSEGNEATSEEETEETPLKSHPPVRPDSQTSHRTASTYKPDRWTEFYKRQLQFQKRSQIAKADQKSRKHRTSMQSCTFKSRPNTQTPTSPHVFKRLARNKDLSQYEAVKRQRDNDKEEAEMALCTFAPVISPKSRDLQRNMSRTRSQPMISQRTALMSKNECSFQPTVSPLKQSMQKAKDYLTDDAFRRLYALKSQTLHQKTVKAEVSVAEPSYRSNLDYPELDRPFFERQALYEIKKKENAEALMAAASSPKNITLKINENSRRMVEGTFESRNAETVRRNQSPKRNSTAEFTFKPQITEQAKALRNRSNDERCHGDFVKRMENIEKLKAIKAKLEREKEKSTMFKALSPRNSTSRLMVVSHPESYVERLNEQSAEKLRCVSQSLTERSARELKDCTFTPKLNKYPSYLKSLG